MFCHDHKIMMRFLIHKNKHRVWLYYYFFKSILLCSVVICSVWVPQYKCEKTLHSNATVPAHNKNSRVRKTLYKQNSAIHSRESIQQHKVRSYDTQSICNLSVIVHYDLETALLRTTHSSSTSYDSTHTEREDERNKLTASCVCGWVGVSKRRQQKLMYY